jgi:hypothetical protein
MLPSSNDIQAEPPRRPYEPRIAPCPFCEEPVASLCLICPHCEATLRYQPDEAINWEPRRRRTRVKIVLGTVGFVAHVVGGQLFIASYWTSGPGPFLVFMIIALVICGVAIGSLSAEPIPGSGRSVLVRFVAWYFVVSGAVVVLLLGSALILIPVF